MPSFPSVLGLFRYLEFKSQRRKQRWPMKAHKILFTLHGIHAKLFVALTSNMVNKKTAEKVHIFKSALLPPEWFSSLPTLLQDTRAKTPEIFATPSCHGLCGQAFKFLQ